MSNFLDELILLSTPEGQRDFLELIDECRKSAGKDWLNELKEFSPDFYKVADLVCNYDFDEAFEIAKKEYPLARMFKSLLRQVHTTLKTEIERKRF